MYQDVVKETPVAEKVSEIQNREDFTRYEEMQMCIRDSPCRERTGVL